MRPLELTLAHFGPYRDRAVLHFEALDRLFLVCGPTGAGKTTLFDALTYALYERTPGTRGGLSDQLASHHAPEGAVPEVSLRFSLGAQQWRVTRQLRHRVPKKKGEGWTERDAQVLLERLEDGAWTPVPGKRSEINQRLEDLLGLSAEEFAKIVVLPQGDFQRFLEASTGEREKMLQKLFPVEAYDRLVEGLKVRAKAVEEARKRWEDRWQELVAQLGPGVDRQALEAAWAEAATEARQAAQEEAAAAEALVRLQGLHADWATLAEKRTDRARLELRRPEREADRLRVDRARKARPLGADLDRQEAIKAEGLGLRADQDKAKGELARVTQGLEELASRAPQTALDQIRLEQVMGDRALAEHQATQWAEIQGLRARETAARSDEGRAQGRWSQAQADLAQARGLLTSPPAGPGWDEALSLVEAAREADVRAREGAEARRRAAEVQAALVQAQETERMAQEAVGTAAREEAFWAQVVGALKAADLAHTLNPGVPCPVCGSPDHPAPATWPEASAGAPGRWQAAQDAMKAAVAAQAAAFARREALEAQASALVVGTDAGNPDETARVLAQAQGHLATLQSWMAAQEKARAAVDKAAAEERAAAQAAQAATQAREAWSTRIGTLEQAIPGDPGPRLATLQKEEAALRQSLEADRLRAEVLGREKEVLTNRIFDLEGRLEAQRVEYRRLQATLDAAVAGLGWTMEELRGARVAEAELAALEDGLASFDRDLHRIAGETSALEAKFEAGPPAPLGPAAQELDALKSRRETLDGVAKEKEFLLRDRDRLEDELREVGKQKEALEGDFQKLVPLARALDGHNGLNLRLTTWVLVQALEQVAHSATHRLASMSGGRYALKVQTRGSDARKDWGLDLAVVDGYTGQERAVGTLSGGEKFMTSISLALGLADVIQERSGGLKLEAIFIDEGFGTLDDQSLDRAMAILHDLGQHRSVGIISHVAELRQRISSRVEVVKGKNGSWLRVE